LVATVADDDLRTALRMVLLKAARLHAWRLRHGWRRCERCGGLHRGRGKACQMCSGEVRERGWRRLRTAMMKRGRP
jgi:hypothetical protein